MSSEHVARPKGMPRKQWNAITHKPVLAGGSPNSRQAGYAQDQAAQQKFNAKVDRAMHQAVLPLMRPNQSSASATQKSVVQTKQKVAQKQATSQKSAQLVPRLNSWLKLLSRPFDNMEVKCPVNYNPAPTIMTSLAKTTCTFRTVVAANATSQLALFGGHGPSSDADAMDGTSYHARQVTINGLAHSISPIFVGAAGGFTNGVISSGLTINQARSDVTGAGNTALSYDQGLPYTGASSNGEHTRWKLNAMGVRLQNVSELTTRGGNVTYVQPSNGTLLTNQFQFSKYPTFTSTQEANTGTLEISWIPRPVDLAFWHSISTTEQAAVPDLFAAGMFVWMNNESTVPQDYYVQIIFHWELGGDNLVSISSPAVLQPADRSIVEPALDVVKFTQPSSKGIDDIAKSVASAMAPLASTAASMATDLLAKHAPSVLTVAGSLFGL